MFHVDWNPVTMEEGITGDAITTYRASKTFAERAAWDFVQSHKPNFDVVTLCPPMVYGPIVNAQTIENLNASSERFWKFLSGKVKSIEPMGAPIWIDVRDLAQAHLAAYERKEAGGNRIFVVADELYSNQDIADIYRKVRTPCYVGCQVFSLVYSTSHSSGIKFLKEHQERDSLLLRGAAILTTIPSQKRSWV